MLKTRETEDTDNKQQSPGQPHGGQGEKLLSRIYPQNSCSSVGRHLSALHAEVSTPGIYSRAGYVPCLKSWKAAACHCDILATFRNIDT